MLLLRIQLLLLLGRRELRNSFQLQHLLVRPVVAAVASASDAGAGAAAASLDAGASAAAAVPVVVSAAHLCFAMQDGGGPMGSPAAVVGFCLLCLMILCAAAARAAAADAAGWKGSFCCFRKTLAPVTANRR